MLPFLAADVNFFILSKYDHRHPVVRSLQVPVPPQLVAVREGPPRRLVEDRKALAGDVVPDLAALLLPLQVCAQLEP